MVYGYTAGPARPRAFLLFEARAASGRAANYTMDTVRHPDTQPPRAATTGSHDEKLTGISSALRRLGAALAFVAAVTAASSAPAHEIPTDVVVQSFLKPADDRVELLLRVPFEAMRDVDIPLRGPGYIEVGEARPYLEDAAEIWLANFVSIYAGGEKLTNWTIERVRLSLPSDRSFASYESAVAHLRGSLDPGTDLYRDQALFDVMLSYPRPAGADDFAIEPGFARLGLRTTTVLNFLPSEGVRRVFEFTGNPGLVPLDPSWHQAFFRFVRLGVDHILLGIDHVLFVLCLIVPYRRIRPLIAIITSFTVAHSITLVASAFGLAPSAPWFPPVIETLIALSILYMAIENIVGTRWDRRWLIAFAFGLVHGFGFSFALGETLQFAGSHLLTSLFAFNLGVEVGQLMIIALAVPLLALLFRNRRSEKAGTIILSALLAHSGWHWMTERASQLVLYNYSLPRLDAALLAALMRWAMLLLIIGLAGWLLYAVFRKLSVNGTGAADQGSSG
jgi:hypothetical protein